MQLDPLQLLQAGVHTMLCSACTYQATAVSVAVTSIELYRMSRSRQQWCLNWHKSLSYGILLHLVLRQTISCLGRFHTEIRFLGCIRHFTASSGLQEMLELIYAPIGSGSCDKCSTNFSGHQFLVESAGFIQVLILAYIYTLFFCWSCIIFWILKICSLVAWQGDIENIFHYQGSM